MQGTFPIRVAAIDIGSNAIRLLAAEITSERTVSVLDQRRVPVRLGHDVFQRGELTPASIASAIAALKRFRRSIEALRITSCRAVATSAVRDSRNGLELVARAREAARISIEVISGSEEARLVHLAVRNRVHLGSDHWVLADLGGGSLEVSRIDHDHVLVTETYPVGSVRILESLPAVYRPIDVRKIFDEHTSGLRTSGIFAAPNKGFIATGGNIEALARLARVKARPNRVPVLGVQRLRDAIQQLAALTYEERIEQIGLRADRADVILPAAIVYEAVAVQAGADSILVPAVGVKEGVLWDMIERRNF
jgi:exopolyphosphatase/guanosine-5'-triphosphate,3'-diphosphate pyrophosphatase